MSKLGEIILRDITSAKPAAGIEGRLYYDTTLERWERDNGATWDVCEPAGVGGGDAVTLQGRALADTAPADGQAVVWDAAGSTWKPGTVSGGGGSDPITALYPTFAVAGASDEFDDASFSGWAAVNSGSNNPTVTEVNNVCSLLLPGGGAAAELHAYVKAVTPSVGDYIEIAMRGMGRAQNYNICGLMFADGATYGAGAQVCFYLSPAEAIVNISNFNGYNSYGGTSGVSIPAYLLGNDMFLRLKYESTNTWAGYVSPDGISWAMVIGSRSLTLTPTHMGFFCTTWGGSLSFVWSLRYFRHGA